MAETVTGYRGITIEALPLEKLRSLVREIWNQQVLLYNTARMKITFRIHAIQRMFERSISADDVRAVLINGITIELYPEDTPCPPRLLLGWRSKRPLHIVVASNEADDEHIIVTAYEPGLTHWESDFKRRKR